MTDKLKLAFIGGKGGLFLALVLVVAFALGGVAAANPGGEMDSPPPSDCPDHSAVCENPPKDTESTDAPLPVKPQEGQQSLHEDGGSPHYASVTVILQGKTITLPPREIRRSLYGYTLPHWENWERRYRRWGGLSVENRHLSSGISLSNRFRRPAADRFTARRDDTSAEDNEFIKKVLRMLLLIIIVILFRMLMSYMEGHGKKR